MLARDQLASDHRATTSAADLGGDAARRHEAATRGGFGAKPRRSRREFERLRLKIKRMQRKLKDTPKIGQPEPTP
jgi:hypothetical protein